MQERGVSEAEVEQVHEDAEVTYPDGRGNRSMVREVGDKTVRIVVSGTDPDFVITVIDAT